MKGILILCGLILAAGAALLVRQLMKPDHFGAPFAGLPLVELKALAAAPAAQMGHGIQVRGRIVRQCPSAGCWFYLDDGAGHQVRIEMGQVFDQLPPRIGRQATVEGSLVKNGDAYELAGEIVEFSK